MSADKMPPLPEMGYLGDDASYGYDGFDMRAYAAEQTRELVEALEAIVALPAHPMRKKAVEIATAAIAKHKEQA